MPNEKQLEQQLDQIRIGSLKLFVNLPKYRRAEAIQKSAGHRNDNSMAKTALVRPTEKEVWRKKTGQVVRKGNNMNGTYAEVVRKTVQGAGKVLLLKLSKVLWHGCLIVLSDGCPMILLLSHYVKSLSKVV